jgi:hypothetical protein
MNAVFTKYKYILIVFAGLILTSCDKKLDVKPQDDISPEQITTEADVTAVLFGAYSGLLDYDAYGERYLLISDLMANESDMAFVGTFQPYRQIYLRTQDRTSTIAAGIWSQGYENINKANIVLSKLDLVSEDNRTAIAAEAKFIRGISYFMLSGFYGKPYADGNLTTNLAVPLILEPILSTSDASKAYVARATVGTVFTQILKDLEEAVEGLPESNGTRADKYAAYAFLSRVYLAEGNYTGAAVAADAVIESGAFALTNTYAGAFNNVANSVEDVFAIQQSEQSNSGTSNNGIIVFYNSNTNGNRGDVQINPNHLNLYEDDDTRGDFFYNGRSIAGSAGLYTYKWSSQYKVIPVVRLAELYLTRGEANLRSGGAIGAEPLDDINMVRERAGATTLADVTADDFVTERYRELAFEGDKFWTKKRLKLNIGSLAYDAGKLVLPVPEREREVNTLLEQNLDY